MSDSVQTWHYGLMARHWAERNTAGPEIAYFQQQIEHYGQPALDAGCGTGRLLIPYLQAGLDVDGCDVSADMLAYCEQQATREGLSPRLYRQALHELSTERRYQTIVACGVFGIGVSREQDFTALQRFYEHLLPGGALLLENYLPYGDARTWPLWRKDARDKLPEPWPDTILDPPNAGGAAKMKHRLVAVDPLQQRLTREMRMLAFQDGQLVADDTRTLTENLYFCNELRALLERAGFTVEAEKGDWTDGDATPESDVIVFIARRQR
jgi:SAM-dependent methyltransferase